jgi:ubiquinone/menaquinone biosynthesis C-methylase UbiE
MNPATPPVTEKEPALSSRELHFGHFSKIREYREVNRELIKQVFEHLPNPFLHVDVATGTGLVPQLLIEQAERRGVRGTVIAVDRDASVLEIAKRVTPQSANVNVEFIQGDARDLPAVLDGKVKPGTADSVSIHDAIHEIVEEKDQRAIYRSLSAISRVGALLSSNSTFTTKSMAIGNSFRGHGEWRLHFAKLANAIRNRNAPKMPFRDPEEYIKMICDAGFDIIYDGQKTVHLSRVALKSIARYPTFIEGFCRDLKFKREFSLAEMSQKMVESVDRIRSDGLPRLWHEIIGCKRDA